ASPLVTGGRNGEHAIVDETGGTDPYGERQQCSLADLRNRPQGIGVDDRDIVGPRAWLPGDLGARGGGERRRIEPALRNPRPGGIEGAREAERRGALAAVEMPVARAHGGAVVLTPDRRAAGGH